MALEIFRLIGSVFVDTDEANKSLKKTDENAQGFGKTLLSGVATAAKWAAGLTAAAGAVAGVAVKSYAEYEQLAGGVETLFKESADMVFKYAEGAHKTAGLSANQYMETITSFAASLIQGLGGDTKEAAKMANMAITDMSDNANKMGSSMESIQNAYQGFAKQNYTMLDNLKLGYGGTQKEMYRLMEDAKKLDSSFDAVFSIDEKGHFEADFNDIVQAIHIVQTEMGITGTTALEASTTISGNINMIKSKLEDFKTTIGSALAPVVKSFLALVIDNLPIIESGVNQLAPVLKGLLEGVLPSLFILVESLLPVVFDLLEAIIPIVVNIVETVLPVLINLIEMLLPPIVQIVNALLPPLLALLMPILDLLGPILELLQPILDLIVGILAPLAELISGLLTPLITIVSKVIEVALIPLQARFTMLSGLLSGTVTAAIDLIMNRVNTIKGVFSGLIQFISGVFTGDWKKALGGIEKIFSSVFEGLKNSFKIPINFIIDGINAFIKGINKLKIPDWVPGVGGKSLNLSTIPKLEQGAVLEKGQTGFLEGNGAEAVVPLHQNKKWISAVAQDMAENGIGGAASNELLEAFNLFVAMLPDILAEAFGNMKLNVNNREFARLVKAVN